MRRTLEERAFRTFSGDQDRLILSTVENCLHALKVDIAPVLGRGMAGDAIRPQDVKDFFFEVDRFLAIDLLNSDRILGKGEPCHHQENQRPERGPDTKELII